MRILILNWRDIKNPRKGGAEILTHEMAKRWVKWGHNVTIFSSIFNNARKTERVDGIKIVRDGHPDARFLFSSVHYKAYKFYRENKYSFDVVVDEAHGLPFFTSLYASSRKAVLICEVAGDVWIRMFGLFFGTIGKAIESFYLKHMYKGTPFLTISESTKIELVKKGVPSQNITVLPMGISFPKKINSPKKEKNPTIIFVGRLAKSKGIEDAILALKKISDKEKNARLWIVGGGEKEYLNYLRSIAEKNEILERIKFWGFVSEEKKFELIGKAHVLVAPSMKEGWGLTVPEAAFMGTPSVVYKSPGLVDVLKDSNFKKITKSNNPNALAEEILNVFTKEIIKERFNPEDYSWDKTASVALRILKHA